VQNLGLLLDKLLGQSKWLAGELAGDRAQALLEVFGVLRNAARLDQGRKDPRQPGAMTRQLDAERVGCTLGKFAARLVPHENPLEHRAEEQPQARARPRSLGAIATAPWSAHARNGRGARVTADAAAPARAAGCGPRAKVARRARGSRRQARVRTPRPAPRARPRGAAEGGGGWRARRRGTVLVQSRSPLVAAHEAP
jgi:hypothetical protein